MKVKVETKVFKEKLSKFSSLIKSNGLLPILDNIILEVKNGSGLRLIGSNLESEVATSVLAEVEGDGSFCIPYRELIKGLGGLKDDFITISFKESKALVEYTTGRFSIGVLNGEDFPRKPEHELKDFFKIGVDTLLEISNNLITYTSSDGLRPTLNGVLFKKEGKTNIMVSTDAHLLGINEVESMEETEDFENIIVNRSALSLLGSVFKNEEEVRFRASDNFGEFKTKDTTLSFTLTEGVYPKYEAVIPTREMATTTLTINPTMFVDVLNRSSFFSNQTSKTVKLVIKNNTVRIETEDVDKSSDFKEEVVSKVEGDDLEIGFSFDNLIKFLKPTLSLDEVKIEFSTASKPAICRFRKNGVEYLNLVMPVMIY